MSFGDLRQSVTQRIHGTLSSRHGVYSATGADLSLRTATWSDHLSVPEKKLMRKWLDGWKVPNLAHVDEFEAGLYDHGFTNVEMHCIDENVIPFSRGTFLRSFPRYTKAKLGQLLGKVSQTEVDHIVACHYQYRTLRKGLWSYQIAYGELVEQ